MSLLRQLRRDSVLWLLEDNRWPTENLHRCRAEAESTRRA